MKIKLIKATVDDAQNLLAMQKICFMPHLQRYRDYESSPATATIDTILWIIENENYYKIMYDNKCVGAINVRKDNDLGEYKLRTINILPEYQGKGVGQVAIPLAEQLFPDATKWYLETLADMPENRHLYEKMGYVFTGKTEMINERLTLVFYEKNVS